MWWIWVLAAATLAVIIAFKRMPIELIYASSATHKKRAFIVKIYGIKVIGDRRKPKKQKNPESEKNAEQEESKEDKKGKDKDKKDKNGGEKDKSEKKDEEIRYKGFMDGINRVKNIYKAASEGIVGILKYLGRKTKCENFTVHLDFGFESAAHTGIAAGVAYGVVYGAASLVYNNLCMEKEALDIEVNPRFDKLCTDLYIKGIFRLSPAHIIKVLIMLMKINKDIKTIIKQ